MVKARSIKYSLIIIALLIYLCSAAHANKVKYLDRVDVKVNGKLKLTITDIDLKRSPLTYLQTPYLRLDRSTRMGAVEKIFEYNDDVHGTDVDLYTTIFIRASAKKNGGNWMLMFDAKTNKLIRVVYSKASQGPVFYKS